MQRKILIVEDVEPNRKLLKLILEAHGYEILEAANGEEAVLFAVERMPDLILMDIQMPVMDGFTATRILKNDPATKDIPIIALTSYAMRGDREKALAAGMDDYISKPISIKEVPLVVERHIAARDERLNADS